MSTELFIRSREIVLHGEGVAFWCPKAPQHGVVGAFLDRDRDGLLVFFVGVASFRVAGAVYFLADLLVAAAPVVMLASGITISRVAPHASRRVEGQWGGAGGASIEEEHAARLAGVRLENQ